MQQIGIGLNRRKDYVVEKKLLSQDYQPKEILSIATFKERCLESGHWFLKGMYPLNDIVFKDEGIFESYLQSAIKYTTFAKILQSIENNS